MAMRSWVLMSWPEVHWELPSQESHWPLFQHMGTNVRGDLDDAGRRMGETVWAARLDDDRVIGAAWEWVELRPGVPAISDPNGFVTNGCLLDANGAALEEPGVIVGLNRIARTIPWQGVVARAVRGEAMVEDLGPLMARLASGDALAERAAGPQASVRRGAPMRRRAPAGSRAALAL
jgi:hypothetical protein